MATNLLNGLRVQNAKNSIESFNYPDGSPRGYMFLAKRDAWDNDVNPPVPENSLDEYLDVHTEMLTLFRIFDDNVYHMIKRRIWSPNVIYDYYAHNINKDNPSHSGANNLYDSHFYVINALNDVYVCLNNNKNSVSTVEPLNASGEPFYTADGYQWMLLYRLNPVMMTNYATPHYMPIVKNNSNVRTKGEINTVIVKFGGTDYTDVPSGTPNRVRAYYCKIFGDGDGAIAKVHMAVTSVGTSVDKVEIVRKGFGYTHGILNFVKGQVYKSLHDLEYNQNGLDPEGNGDFTYDVIISPPSGWGYDLPLQLGGTSVGVFTNILPSTTDVLNDVEFRRVGILQDPVLITNDYDTLNGTHSMLLFNVYENDYVVGEEITQAVNDGTARGTVVAWDKDNSILSYTQSVDVHLDGGKLRHFMGTEPVVGQSSQTTHVVNQLFTGRINDIDFVEGFAEPEYEHNTGTITYLSNLQPIQKSKEQNERLSIILKF
jgi:hypothetical protein